MSRIAPLIITLRGSKRGFSTAQRTLENVAKQQARPASFTPPSRLSFRVDVERRDDNGWPIYTLTPKDSSPERSVLLLHGGCYVFEITSYHWKLAADLAVQANARVVVPVMPLAPAGTARFVVPAIADLAASIIETVGSDCLSLVGDSSGGGMALAVAIQLRDRGVAPLHRVVLIAPWLDISGTDPMIATIAPLDPWLAVPGTRAAGALYRAELGERDWRVSPLFGDFSGLGPITLFSGTRDICHADAVRFLDKARQAGLDVDYHEGTGMLHVYPILPMPEGDEARKSIAAAVR